MKPSSPYRTPSPPPSPPHRANETGGGLMVAAMCVLYAAALLGTGSAVVSTGIALILSAITIGVVGGGDKSATRPR